MGNRNPFLKAIFRIAYKPKPCQERQKPLPLLKTFLARAFGPLLLLALLSGGILFCLPRRPISHLPGVLVPADPVQTACDAVPITPPADSRYRHYGLTKLAGYRIRARVLSIRSYGDAHADLCPVDLALGWGRMSDSATLARLSISQQNRFYFYEWRNDPPIPPEEIVTHSANVHIIPADREVAAAIGEFKTGSLVDLSGLLVEAKQGKFTWRSSLTRADSGPGACELMVVTRAQPFSEEITSAASPGPTDLNQWYASLQSRLKALDRNNADAVRAFNVEALRYMAVAHPSPGAPARH